LLTSADGCRYDFMIFLTNASQSRILEQTFPGVLVHEVWNF
jgi:hypothetical protein